MNGRILLAMFAGALLAPELSHAQNREPLCVPVASRRLARGTILDPTDDNPLRGGPLPNGGYAFVVRDDAFALRPQSATPGDSASSGNRPVRGLSVVRIDADLRATPEVLRIEDPESVRMGVLASAQTAAIGTGLLVLAPHGANLWATTIPAEGPVPPLRSIAQAPDTAHPFVWATAVSRGDGALALAGTADGDVVALRFDRTGALRGSPSNWTHRVGGPMQLLPVEEGPAAALLGRPVPGSGPNGEQARMQVLVTLDDALAPVGEPFGTGFAQFPLAFAMHGHSLTIVQWADRAGLAIATLPVGEHRIGEQLPRVFEAQPPLEGALLGQGSTVGTDGVLYDLAAYAESAGGVHTHLAWIPPSGTPVIRRDVLPLRGHLYGAPVLFPAADGIVVITAIDDETGGAIDAYHVRCDLVDTHAE